MKTERRHELQTNELADWLGRTIELIEANYRAVLGVLVAVVVVVGAALYLRSESTSRRSEGWDRFFQAQASQDFVGDMLSVSENYDGTSAGAWAKLIVADSQLIQATDQLFQNRADANDKLRRALTGYQEVADSSIAERDPLLQQRAILGMARSYESLNQLDKARDEYKKLTDTGRWANPIFTEQAERRLKALDQPSTKQFYDWFAKHEPLPPSSAPTADQLKANLNSLPDSPPTTPAPETPPAAAADTNAPAEGAGDSTPAEPPATPPAAEPATQPSNP